MRSLETVQGYAPPGQDANFGRVSGPPWVTFGASSGQVIFWTRLFQPMFIVLEGIDGSGTTTQMQLLSRALLERGHDVLSTAQPSKGPMGQMARERLSADRASLRGAVLDPEILALLFAADRLEHYQRLLAPALQRGAIVVCDRYLLSSWAYQGLDCPADWVQAINRFAPWPDRSYFLEIEAKTAVSRVQARSGVREIYDALPQQQRLAGAYREIVQRLEGSDPEHPICRIDAARDINEVHAQILADLEPHLPAPARPR